MLAFSFELVSSGALMRSLSTTLAGTPCSKRTSTAELSTEGTTGLPCTGRPAEDCMRLTDQLVAQLLLVRAVGLLAFVARDVAAGRIVLVRLERGLAFGSRTQLKR